MTKHEWTLQETFYFPEQYGAFADAKEIKVTPGFTEERTEDAIRLHGIYHVAANVVFDEDKPVSAEAEDRLVIEDVEVNQNIGYFEYAVPLNVDLPADHAGPLELHVSKKDAVQLEDGGMQLQWSVYLPEPQAAQEEAAPQTALAEDVQQTARPEPIAQAESPSSSHAQFLANADQIVEQAEKEMEDFLLYVAALDDDVTRKIFHSNNVFVEAERQGGQEAE